MTLPNLPDPEHHFFRGLMTVLNSYHYLLAYIAVVVTIILVIVLSGRVT